MAAAAILHEYGFTPMSLRSALLSMGFRVITIRNAGLSGGTSWMNLNKSFRFAFSGFLGVIAWVTGGRLLWAPSLEVEAEKLARPDNASSQPE